MESHPELTLPERIRCARKHAGMSQEGLRLAAGAGKGMGQKWELPENDPSHRRPSNEMIQTIASICGVDWLWIATGKGDMALESRLQIGGRIVEAVQSAGGANKVGPLLGTTSETLRRWMRVGPANTSEAMALEKGLPKAGIRTDQIRKIFDPTPTEETASLVSNLRGESVKRTPHAAKNSAGWVDIPIYTARAAAGSGYENGPNEISSEIRLSQDHIRRVLHVPPSALALIQVDGDSMTPLLHPGDVIFIDTRSPGPVTEGIYLFRQDDARLVKQLQRIGDGAIQVSSRNPAYAPYTITASNDGFEVIGRVVGKCGRI